MVNFLNTFPFNETMNLKNFYRKNYKILMIIPFILLIISVAFISIKYIKTGELVNRDISLKGGISATVYSDKEVDVNELKNNLVNDLKSEISVRELSDLTTKKQIGIIIETSDISVKDKLKDSIENNLKIKLNEENYSVEEVGSSLGEGFYKDMIKAVIIAFILMGIVVFISFRIWVPSLAVILSAFLDIIATLMFVNLIGIKISAAGIASFLLIIGYSIDTDILLTTRVLKRTEKGSVVDRIFDSVGTGLTMTATTIIALTIGYFVATSSTLKEMFSIILIAMFIDVISTYFMNAGILMIYKRNELKNEA